MWIVSEGARGSSEGLDVGCQEGIRTQDSLPGSGFGELWGL